MRPFTTTHTSWKSDAIPKMVWRQSILRLISTQCQSLSELHPRVYLLGAASFALIGFAYLLLFPCLIFISVNGLYDALLKSQTIIWSHVLIWLAMAAFSILVSHRIICFRPEPPTGSDLNIDAAPLLNQLVKDLLKHFCSTRVDNIVLSNNFELDILKTPTWALPVWSTNTLVIGLPMIQCLSASQFQCALARRLGQFSKRHNWLENWLYQLREVWPQYCGNTQKYDLGYQPVRWFFSTYAPLYKVITVPVARLDELAADDYAMEVFSDEQVLDTITTQMVCDRYLLDKYWPVMRKIASNEKHIINEYHSGMARVLRNGLQGDNVKQWLANTVSAEPEWNDATPSLAKRVENIGHTQACMDAISSESAASIYLGTESPS
jgi:hypothetical protein